MKGRVYNRDGRCVRYAKDIQALMRAIDEGLTTVYGKGLAFYQRRDRHRDVADVRNMAMCVAWELSRFTLKDIAAQFNRNHSTMCCSMASVRDLRLIYPSFEKEYMTLQSKIYEICERESILCGGFGF